MSGLVWQTIATKYSSYHEDSWKIKNIYWSFWCLFTDTCVFCALCAFVGLWTSETSMNIFLFSHSSCPRSVFFLFLDLFRSCLYSLHLMFVSSICMTLATDKANILHAGMHMSYLVRGPFISESLYTQTRTIHISPTLHNKPLVPDKTNKQQAAQFVWINILNVLIFFFIQTEHVFSPSGVLWKLTLNNNNKLREQVHVLDKIKWW